MWEFGGVDARTAGVRIGDRFSRTRRMVLAVVPCVCVRAGRGHVHMHTASISLHAQLLNCSDSMHQCVDAEDCPAIHSTPDAICVLAFMAGRTHPQRCLCFMRCLGFEFMLSHVCPTLSRVHVFPCSIWQLHVPLNCMSHEPTAHALINTVHPQGDGTKFVVGISSDFVVDAATLKLKFPSFDLSPLVTSDRVEVRVCEVRR